MTLRTLICMVLVAAALPAQIRYPESPARPVNDTYHGARIEDPYRWLEEDQSPETRAWIDAQMKVTRSLLDARGERAAWRQLLSELLRVDRTQPPTVRNGRYYYVKRPAQAVRDAIYYRPSKDAPEQVLIEASGENTSVNLLAVSGDGRWVAYGVRTGGADEQEVFFVNADTKQRAPVSLPASRYGRMDMTRDGSRVYYSDLPVGGPRVFTRSLTEADSEARQLYGQGLGGRMSTTTRLSEDERHLLVEVREGAASDRVDVRVLELSTGRWIEVVKDLGAHCRAQIQDGRVYLLTNWNAPRQRVFRIDLTRPQRHFWKLIVPEGRDAIEELHLAGGHLLLKSLRDATHRLSLYELDGRPVREAPLPGLGSANRIEAAAASDEIFFQYTSLNMPPSVLRHEVSSGRQQEWARDPAPVDSASLEVKQVWFQSKDGTRVPMFVMAARNTPLDGRRPTLLYGYGGFTVSITPNFSHTYAAWVSRGGVVAVANLRGGGEFGEAWHKAGRLERKQNVFDDFIAAAEWLIANRYTNSSKLAVYGGSNGGLLVGALMTQRPELARAVICSVPLLDMLRYHKFLIAPLWVPEYGSSEDPRQFEYLRRYSPYHNVKRGEKYPAVLFVTGDSDTRVAPLHARKMAALMQAASGSGHPVLLHYDTVSGHSGGQPVTKQIEDGADMLTFLSWQLGE